MEASIQKKVYEIDGNRFQTLEEFYAEIGRVLIPDSYWGSNLDAFNDILRGKFGTPEEGFVIKWIHSNKSRECLGYPETIKQLRKRLIRCHPSNRKSVAADLLQAESNKGPTVFDWLVEIIQDHCIGGREEEDGVELILE